MNIKDVTPTCFGTSVPSSGSTIRMLIGNQIKLMKTVVTLLLRSKPQPTGLLCSTPYGTMQSLSSHFLLPYTWMSHESSA